MAQTATILTMPHATTCNGQKPFRIGWSKLLSDRLGIYRALHDAGFRKGLEQKLGAFPTFFISEAEADSFIEKYLRIVGLEKTKPTRTELTAAQQKKLDIAIKIEHARLSAQYEGEVSAEVTHRCALREARCKELECDAIEREAQCSAAMAKIDSYMTEDEYKFILNCLHPDRAPEDRKEKFSKAFVIISPARFARCSRVKVLKLAA